MCDFNMAILYRLMPHPVSAPVKQGPIFCCILRVDGRDKETNQCIGQRSGKGQYMFKCPILMGFVTFDEE